MIPTGFTTAQQIMEQRQELLMVTTGCQVGGGCMGGRALGGCRPRARLPAVPQCLSLGPSTPHPSRQPLASI